MAFLLCGPGSYVHKPDVQNKWDDDTHTHNNSTIDPYIIRACSLDHKKRYNIVIGEEE